MAVLARQLFDDARSPFQPERLDGTFSTASTEETSS